MPLRIEKDVFENSDILGLRVKTYSPDIFMENPQSFDDIDRHSRYTCYCVRVLIKKTFSRLRKIEEFSQSGDILTINFRHPRLPIFFPTTDIAAYVDEVEPFEDSIRFTLKTSISLQTDNFPDIPYPFSR